MSKTAHTPIEAANRLIERLLASMLESAPGASRVCLTGFGAENSLTGAGRLSSGNARKPPSVKMCLPAMREGHCSPLRMADFQADATEDFLLAFGAAGAALVCPAADLSGNRVGAVCMLWDGDDRPPGNEQLIALMALGVRVGGQIAEVLELCRHAIGSAEWSTRPGPSGGQRLRA